MRTVTTTQPHPAGAGASTQGRRHAGTQSRTHSFIPRVQGECTQVRRYASTHEELHPPSVGRMCAGTQACRHACTQTRTQQHAAPPSQTAMLTQACMHTYTQTRSGLAKFCASVPYTSTIHGHTCTVSTWSVALATLHLVSTHATCQSALRPSHASSGTFGFTKLSLTKELRGPLTAELGFVTLPVVPLLLPVGR